MISKTKAREILQGIAYAEWAETLDYARKIRCYVLAGDAQDRLLETLRGIEDWLDAVYDQGRGTEDADSEFMGNADRVRGLGYRTPSQVLEVEVKREAS